MGAMGTFLRGGNANLSLDTRERWSTRYLMAFQPISLPFLAGTSC